MPLLTGNSPKVIAKNVNTLIDEYSQTGKIGTSHPKSTSAAYKQASAIAHRQAKNYRPRRRKK